MVVGKYLAALVGLLSIALAAGAARGAARGAAAKPGFVQVELIAEQTAAVPGKPTWIGLSMQHDAGWHTYWKNPGDAGLPTTIQFTLPSGFKVGAIEWPYPERIPVKQLASYGYSDQIVLPLLLFVPRQTNAKQVTLKARADWLVCKDSCIPEGADLELVLPIAPRASASNHKPRFDAARAALPRPVANASATAVRSGGQLIVSLALPPALQTAGQLFLEREDVVEPGPTPQVQAGHGRVIWQSVLTANGRALGAPAVLKAVWVPAAPLANQPRAARLEVQLNK